MANSFAPASPDGQERCDSPVFVLTASRSGSTLLRFLLDSHPSLACPPETSIASMCGGLARSLDILESAGSGTGRPVNAEPKLSDAITAVIRNTVDAAFGGYLERRGGQRWCDKSLDTFQFAGLLAQVYPRAQFICLYRHCMDVIASGVEACPWGLHRFGFDPHVAQHPGNSVAAIGSYWLACAQTIMAFEEQNPDRCVRVRYEDMVTAPEETAAKVFSFLGVEQAPGITETCFQMAHEGEGPGDEKIWFTSGVTAGSLGRGVSVPFAALPPPLVRPLNELLGKLDYRLVEEGWNDSSDQLDPRAHPPADPAAADGQPDAADNPDAADATRVTESLAARITAQQEAMRDEITARWPAIAGATVELVVLAARGAERTLRLGFPTGADGWTLDDDALAGVDAPTAKIMASHDTWQSLLEGRSNPVTEMTTGRLRCVNKRDDHRIRSDEMHAVAALLGIARIPVTRG
jgi:protein-tyrosine sulfotransferase